MLGSCRCNKSTFAQLSLNEARIWRSFQSQWSKRSSSTQLSWTTFHHDQERMMAVSWYKVLQHFQMIGTSWNHLNKTWTQPVHSMNPCKDTLKLCAAVLQTWSKKARISPSTNIFNNKLVENTSDFNFMMMSVILVFFSVISWSWCICWVSNAFSEVERCPSCHYWWFAFCPLEFPKRLWENERSVCIPSSLTIVNINAHCGEGIKPVHVISEDDLEESLCDEFVQFSELLKLSSLQIFPPNKSCRCTNW